MAALLVAREHLPQRVEHTRVLRRGVGRTLFVRVIGHWKGLSLHVARREVDERIEHLAAVKGCIRAVELGHRLRQEGRPQLVTRDGGAEGDLGQRESKGEDEGESEG